MTPIYLTSFFRPGFTRKTIDLIHARTKPGSFEIHVFDNGSDQVTQDFLIGELRSGKIKSLHLDSRNTGCVYNKGIFQAMTETSCKYYVVSDNDVYPPMINPDWLSQLIAIMEAHPNLAFLAPQLPPQWLQTPDMSRVEPDIVYCKAVGNTLKLVRREAYPLDFKSELGAFGDDGIICDLARSKGYDTAFCRTVFCFHAGQCENWGYQKEEIALDPRKAGYGGFFSYEYHEASYRPKLEKYII